MSQVIEETEQAEQKAEKNTPKLVQAAGVGMALMGSSLAHAEPHVDHGYAPARWAAAAVSIIGFLIGGLAFPFGIWALVAVGGALQLVAIAVNLGMNAAGMGATCNDRWAAAKAEAKAARAV
ncbi:MAG TPA: hypothetical protein VH372_11795 [Actinospica sp.]|jgi:hypothetical protein|nr:hypothetical protein [Actinospica sp.]